MRSGNVGGVRHVLARSKRALRRGAIGAVAVFSVALLPATAQAATLLYPNLKTLPPRDLRFDRADVDPEGGGAVDNVLRFSNTVWNSGPGPLEMRGTIDSGTNEGAAVQRVYDDSGGFTDFAAGEFYYHPEHGHYHYDDWGRYELWTKSAYEAWLASGRTEGNPMIGSKTTSCMIDEEFIRNVPNQPYPPEYGTGGCIPDSQGRMLQGISPGWGDTYDYFRFEQWIDLGASGTLADGNYVLRSVTDPLNKIYESAAKADTSRENQEDNEAITPFAVSGGALVDLNPPSGSVRIDDTDVATASPEVIVKVLGRDDISGVTAVRLSNDGTHWSTPQPYTGQESTAQSIAWNLSDAAYGGSPADGVKTVFAEFRDAAGKWSSAETDTIVLDRSGNSSSYSNAVLADGPSGYWRLGETGGTTASDIAGANPGIYRNGAQLGQPSLLPADAANDAIALDGVNDHVEIPSSSSLSPTARVSVEAWIKPAALPATGEFASIASKPGSYALQLDGPRLEFATIQSGSYRRLGALPGTIEAGHVYHVVGTYDGAEQRLYVDGVEVGETAVTGPLSAGAAELSIGSWNASIEPFHGAVDEIAVYPGALSADRVAAHYEVGLDGTLPDTAVMAPGELSALAVSEHSIELHWSDNSDNEGEFRIERATDPGFGSPYVQAVWANSTSFTDSGLSPGVTYYYRVRARNATDGSGYSNLASATTMRSSLADSSPVSATNVSTARGRLLLPGNAYAAAVIGDRPLAYWKLDERSGVAAFDLRRRHSGRYRSGPRLGRPSLLPADPGGRSVRFRRGGERVVVRNGGSLEARGRISIEAWIEPRALPRAHRLALIAGEPGAFALRLEGHRLTFAVGHGRRGRRDSLRAPVGAVAVGEVHHLVATYDGTTARLFVDGVRVAGARIARPRLARGRNFAIGSAGRRQGQFLGVIDEVAVYPRPLTPAQASHHYRAGTWPRRNS